MRTVDGSAGHTVNNSTGEFTIEKSFIIYKKVGNTILILENKTSAILFI